MSGYGSSFAPREFMHLRGSVFTWLGTRPPGSYRSCSAYQSSRQKGTFVDGSVKLTPSFACLTRCAHSRSALYTLESAGPKSLRPVHGFLPQTRKVGKHWASPSSSTSSGVQPWAMYSSPMIGSPPPWLSASASAWLR